MDIRNEIKSHIVREGITIREVIARLVLRYGWSKSVSNFTGKLRRGTLKYTEAMQLADVIGYDIIWKKR